MKITDLDLVRRSELSKSEWARLANAVSLAGRDIKLIFPLI